MKKLFYLLQIVLFIAFNFFLLLTGYQLASKTASAQSLAGNTPQYDQKEEYDPTLHTLNTVDKVVAFCDGIYMGKATKAEPNIEINEVYPDIVSSVIRKRFYHGYSTYGMNNNYMASMISGVTVEGLNAIVLPNDILKYNYAACSQQSIVFMEVLRRKGFPTRKIIFQGKESGHFCFEVFYNKSWHFYDPDMEPNKEVLTAYNHPSIDFLTSNPEILLKAYHQYPKEKTLDLFLNYTYGSVNTFAAPKAIIFQKASKFLSYTIWSFFLFAFILVRRKYKRIGQPRAIKSQRRPFMIKRSIPAYSAA